jgi:transposase
MKQDHRRWRSLAMRTGSAALFYEFRLGDAVPEDHLVRKIDAALDLSWLHSELAPYYSSMGRPSIDPELMIRMLVVGYVFAIRSERRICREVQGEPCLSLVLQAWYRGCCPRSFGIFAGQNGRFRKGDVFRRVFERVVEMCIAAGTAGLVRTANRCRHRRYAPQTAKISLTKINLSSCGPSPKINPGPRLSGGPLRVEERRMTDIYDGAEWTEMDIEDLKAGIAAGRSIAEAAAFLCRADSIDDVRRSPRDRNFCSRSNRITTRGPFQSSMS